MADFSGKKNLDLPLQIYNGEFHVFWYPFLGQRNKPGNLLLPVSGEHELRLFGGVDHDDLKPGATGQSEGQRPKAICRFQGCFLKPKCIAICLDHCVGQR